MDVFMRVSAIEIGTNSTKFIIAQLNENGAVEVITRTSTVNRLSSGMYPENNLKPEAIEKGIEIIGNLIKESNAQGAKMVSIFSTSVLRDAGNKEAFIGKVKELFGIDINVISGEEEAQLAYMACREVVENKSQKFSVIDIGGGSTEIIIGNGTVIEQKISLDVGAVRLTEMFVSHDPIEDSEVEQMTAYIEKQINERESLDLSGLQLVGTGGTIKTLGTLFYQKEHSKEKSINGKVIKKHEIELLFSMLKLLNIESKKKLIGLNPKRADVITSGIKILLSVMDKFNIEEIKISSQGVLEGFIAQYLQNPK
ncbi:Ppx/GppA family phosphatase [Ruminiclostridium herbifermentans]|uniref:Ppx/GppA family phosphatase n=2 Tax=Ruminiclostridium herbifermentans TaxID=2488810 RepID=A0A7H1VKB7_9FIRM|nr:Ppx/GppA family phosphatase [Ruminiclostridium herbifermentans]